MVDALNLNSIRFTNFPMNTSSDPIMPSFVLSHIHCRIWLIVSPALLHILHFVCSCDLSIFPLIALLRRACCSWAATIKLSFSCFRVPFQNHCHLSWFHTSLFYRTNWPCKLFSSQKILFRLIFLLSLNCSFSDWLRSRTASIGLFFLVFLVGMLFFLVFLVL